MTETRHPIRTTPLAHLSGKNKRKKDRKRGFIQYAPASRVLPENLEDLVLRLKSPNASALATPAVEVPAKVNPNLLKST